MGIDLKYLGNCRRKARVKRRLRKEGRGEELNEGKGEVRPLGDQQSSSEVRKCSGEDTSRTEGEET